MLVITTDTMMEVEARGGVGRVRLWSVKPPVVRLEDGAEIKVSLISER